MALLHTNSRRARIACLLSAVALLSSARNGWFSVRDGTSRSPGGGNKKNEEDDGVSRRSRKRPRQESPPVFYSYMRPDRAGAVIQDMLLAHAFAFERNMTYGGACPPRSTSENDQRRRSTNLTASQVSSLLFYLGLDDVLPIACPPPANDDRDMGGTNNAIPPHHNQPRAGPLLDRRYYGRYHLRFCNSEWQRYMRAKVQRRIDEANRMAHAAKQQPQHQPVHRKAVLHIRRGDVTPCDPDTSERYLPNAYYLEMLERYVVPMDHHRVTIYSERSSIEPWDDFRNCTLRLDGGDRDDRARGGGVNASSALSSSSMQDLANIWLDMITADVLIMSKSSFSVVPALLGGGPTSPVPTPSALAASRFTPPQIVYADFWIEPLPHWTRVPQNLLRQAAVDAERVKKQYCPPRDGRPTPVGNQGRRGGRKGAVPLPPRNV
jgi:hypothetical protein